MFCFAGDRGWYSRSLQAGAKTSAGQDTWPSARQRELSQVPFPEMGGIQRQLEYQLYSHRCETKAVM